MVGGDGAKRAAQGVGAGAGKKHGLASVFVAHRAEKQQADGVEGEEAHKRKVHGSRIGVQVLNHVRDGRGVHVKCQRRKERCDYQQRKGSNCAKAGLIAGKPGAQALAFGGYGVGVADGFDVLVLDFLHWSIFLMKRPHIAWWQVGGVSIA